MIELTPIATVRAARVEARDDFWGGVESRVELEPHVASEALDGIETFSHAEILFWFHLVDPGRVEAAARHPRNNPDWPRVGIFAQRGKNRPNRLGSTIVTVVRREERTLVVRELDAVDGTPVVDIKPVMAEFLPRGPLRQPAWTRALMRDYWERKP